MKKNVLRYSLLITVLLAAKYNASAQTTTPTVGLTEVVITADSSKLDKGQSVETLTTKDFDRNSGLSLQNSINMIPGVQMQSRTPWGGQHIVIRGYYPSADNGRTNGENFSGLGYKLYINNIPVTDATGTTVMDDIDFSMLDKAEIIKGPSSSLYGSAIGGTVSLFTARPKPGTSINEEAIVGSYGLFRDNTSIQCGGKNSDIVINYGHQNYEGFRDHDDSKKDYASFSGNFYVSDKQTISTYFSYNHSYEDLSGELDSADFYNKSTLANPAYLQNNSHVQIESFRSGVTDKYQFNKHFNNQTTLFTTASALNQYFAHGFNKNQNLNFGGRTAFGYQTTGGKVGINGTLGAAFQKSNQTAQGNFILPFVAYPFTPSSKPDNPSDAFNYAMDYNVFTQWIFSLPARFTLNVGGSLNFDEFGTQNVLNAGAIYLDNPTFVQAFKPVFTYNASLAKVFSNAVSLYANVGSGYAPALLSQIVNSVGQVDKDLKPETAMQYELGSKGELTKDKKLSYQLAVFDLDVKNRLTSETANSITSYVNEGEQRNMGVELSLSYAIIKNEASAITLLRPWVSYSYSDFKYISFQSHAVTKVTKVDTVIADYSNNKVAAVSPNVFNAGIDLETKLGFYLFPTFEYVDKAPVTFDNSHSMKAYQLLNAKIGYRHQFGKFGVNIFAGVDNILGSTYYSFIFVGQNIQELGQGTDANIKGGGGDGYILPAPYKATFYGGVNLSYRF